MAAIAQSVIDLAYGMDGDGFESRQGQEMFLFSKASMQVLRPSSLLVNESRGSLLVIKQPAVEVDQ
jgi:hypothetical protein